MADKLMTPAEVAELLGFAAGTILDWAEADRIPHFKIGTALRFRQSEVEAWLEEQRRGPGAVTAPASLTATRAIDIKPVQLKYHTGTKEGD